MTNDGSQRTYGRPSGAMGGFDIGLAQRLATAWHTALAVGLITLVLGILIVAWPEVTIGILAILIGLQLILFGVFNIIRAIASSDTGGGARVLFAVLGVLAIAVGVLAMRHLLQTVEVLAILIGLTWLIGGIIEFVGLVSGPAMPGRGWSIALAVLTGLAGIVVLAYPTPSLVTLAVLFGIWLIVWGILTCVLALAVRSAEHRAHRVGPVSAPPA